VFRWDGAEEDIAGERIRDFGLLKRERNFEIWA